MTGRSLKEALLELAEEGSTPGGEKYRFLSHAAAEKLSLAQDLHYRAIEIAALEEEIVPERYQRNIGTIGIEGQKQLLQSTVGIVGVGGLGGTVIELLARMGAGRLVVIDGDLFADSNLNRQLLATETNLGEPKVEAAARRVKIVNSSVEVITHNCIANTENLPSLMAECNIAIDCLDNLSSRFDLEKACQKLGIVLIHGAIAGFLGQLAVIRPGSPVLAAIYGSPSGEGPDRGVEMQLGNPAATPTMLAAWQVGEAVKILADLDGSLPCGEMLIIDMQAGESYRIKVTA